MHRLVTGKQQGQAGFTMVEMLVYLAIFLVTATASVTFMFSLDNFIDQYRLETMLYRSGTSIMEHVQLAIRQADQVDTFNTVEDNPSAGKLTVANVSTTTSFTLNGGALEMSINGTEYGDLTSNDVTVDSFTVYHYPQAVGEFVRVRLHLTGTLDGSVSKSVILYGGAVVRGSI